jgi:hypothetical protein
MGGPFPWAVAKVALKTRPAARPVCCPTPDFFRQIISDRQNFRYTAGFAEMKPMRARAAPPPVRSLTEEHKRARRVFARLMAGESIRAIAASETLSVRRVQQIVRDQLDRRDANPADDFALLQMRGSSGLSTSSAARSTPASLRRRMPSSASSTI